MSIGLFYSYCAHLALPFAKRQQQTGTAIMYTELGLPYAAAAVHPDLAYPDPTSTPPMYQAPLHATIGLFRPEVGPDAAAAAPP